MTHTLILPKFTKPIDSRVSNSSGSSSSIIFSVYSDISSPQRSKPYEVDPKINNIKESCISFLKNDQEFLKQILTEYVKNNPEVVRQILNDSLNTINNTINTEEEIIFRSIDKINARKEVQEYIKNHQGCLTSEIIEGLRIDPLLVMEILKELREQNLVENKPIEQ